MSVLSSNDIAQGVSARASMEPDRAARGVAAAVDWIRARLFEGLAVRLQSFAEFQVQQGDGRVDGKHADLPSDEASRALAAALASTPEVAGAFGTHLLAVIGEALLRGDRVEIERLVSLGVAEEKAAVAQGEAGNRVITPARRVLSYSLDPELKARAGEGRKIAFLPDPGLKDRIARLKASTILLVVPAEDFFAKTLVYHFRRAGWEVQVSTDCQKAIEQVERGETYEVIFDDPMPNSQALLERLKGFPETSRVPVISMLPAGVDPKAMEGFRLCPDQAVSQPFEVKALLDKAENELARVAEEKAIFRQEVLFRFSTVDKCIDRANEMGARLFERSGLDDEGQVALCAAFREAIGNAAQHGNRYRKDKYIEILYLLDPEKITANVTDQGKGFDHRLYTNRGAGGDAIAAARERHQQGRLGGLGIMLMMKCTDKLEYNEAGNSVTLTKMIRKKA